MLQDNVVMLACGVAAVVVGIFIFWGPDVSSSKKRKGGVVGLVNLGHTCFLNTLLQALSPCLPLVDWLLQQHQLHDSSTLTSSLSHILLDAKHKKQEVGIQFLATAASVCYYISNFDFPQHPNHGFSDIKNVLSGRVESERDVLVPSNIISSLESHGWAISPGQQDAHELFHVLLTTLEEEAHKLSSKKVSLVNVLDGCEEDAVVLSPKHRPRVGHEAFKLAVSPFQGLLTNQLQCVHCGHKTSLRYDKFDSLSLNLLEQSLQRGQTLAHLLAKFVSTELVKGVACEGCDSPVASAMAFKTLRLGKLPPCLCLHISRTTWQDSGQAFKRLDYVEFPEMLNLNPYTFSPARKEITQSTGSAEQHKDDVMSSPRPLRLNHMYKLVSVVVHSGSASSGHFITYRLCHGSKSSWWFTSDTEVHRCSVADVMKACAYMLFYIQCSSHD